MKSLSWKFIVIAACLVTTIVLLSLYYFEFNWVQSILLALNVFLFLLLYPISLMDQLVKSKNHKNAMKVFLIKISLMNYIIGALFGLVYVVITQVNNYIHNIELFILSLITYLGWAIVIYRKRKTTLFISESGVFNNVGEQLINYENLTEIEVSEKEIAFHTDKYRNDLVINKKSIIEPAYAELLNFLDNFRSLKING